jgi:hypothetical protein
MALTTGATSARAALTGRELGQHRLALGISVYHVSQALGIAPQTLCLWERDTRLLDTERQARWQAVLGVCAVSRIRGLAQQGWALDTLLRMSLRTAAQLYYYGAHAGKGSPQ